MEIKFGFRGLPGTVADLQHAVGDGWADIILRLVTDLEAMGWNGEVVQVKEKFGSLRFYVNSATDEIYERIGQASGESCRTCEVCGEPGVIRTGGWFKCLCDTHSEGRDPWGLA